MSLGTLYSRAENSDIWLLLFSLQAALTHTTQQSKVKHYQYISWAQCYEQDDKYQIFPLFPLVGWIRKNSEHKIVLLEMLWGQEGKHSTIISCCVNLDLVRIHIHLNRRHHLQKSKRILCCVSAGFFAAWQKYGCATKPKWQVSGKCVCVCVSVFVLWLQPSLPTSPHSLLLTLHFPPLHRQPPPKRTCWPSSKTFSMYDTVIQIEEHLMYLSTRKVLLNTVTELLNEKLLSVKKFK